MRQVSEKILKFQVESNFYHFSVVPSSSDVRALEVNQMRLKNATLAQRSFLRRPHSGDAKGIVDEVLGRDERTVKEMIRGMTMEQRQQAERKDVLRLINALISQGSFFDTVDEAQSFGVKINALRERLRRMFELIRTVLATYRGGLCVKIFNFRFLSLILFPPQ